MLHPKILLQSLHHSTVSYFWSRLGGDTRTTGIRGEARRQELERRLQNILVDRGLIGSSVGDDGSPKAKIAPRRNRKDIGEVDWSSIISIRNCLQYLGQDTKTSGLRGEARKKFLAERLRSALENKDEILAKMTSDAEADAFQIQDTAIAKIFDPNTVQSQGPQTKSLALVPTEESCKDNATETREAPAVPKLQLGLWKNPKPPFVAPYNLACTFENLISRVM